MVWNAACFCNVQWMSFSLLLDWEKPKKGFIFLCLAHFLCLNDEIVKIDKQLSMMIIKRRKQSIGILRNFQVDILMFFFTNKLIYVSSKTIREANALKAHQICSAWKGRRGKNLHIHHKQVKWCWAMAHNSAMSGFSSYKHNIMMWRRKESKEQKNHGE